MKEQEHIREGLAQAAFDYDKAPGHWLLARMGRRVRRHGGRELTEKLVAALKIAAEDDVVEFAPGLGFTAGLVLQHRPHSYTSVERNEKAAAEVPAFREQVQPINMIGCTDVAAIHARVKELASNTQPAPPGPHGKAGLSEFKRAPGMVGQVDAEHVIATATDPQRIKLDKAGYFVIHVLGDALAVEHYDYDEKLLRVIEGRDARSIYLTLIRNGWVSQLDHAAYLGKELARAEWCMKHGVRFVQDGA
jgi:hypothetical protein